MVRFGKQLNEIQSELRQALEMRAVRAATWL